MKNIKTIDSFKAGIRSAIRGFWSGELSRSQFADEMRTTINTRLNQAFDDTAKSHGIEPTDYTIDEQLWIGRFINDQLTYISDFADSIENNSKVNGGKLTPLLNRGEMWVNRWNEVQNRATTFFDGNGKYEWVVGPTEHCSSCIRLNGIVKRGSFWEQAAFDGIHPQSKNLACKGYKCLCRLQQTNKPISRGPLPRI